jgi:predicted membrane protein
MSQLLQRENLQQGFIIVGGFLTQMTTVAGASMMGLLERTSTAPTAVNVAVVAAVVAAPYAGALATRAGLRRAAKGYEA